MRLEVGMELGRLTCFPYIITRSEALQFTLVILLNDFHIS